METGFLIGLWGFVWVRLLCQPGEVFDFVAKWVYEQTATHDSQWAEKAYKAICGCAKCHAGQVAFWSAFLTPRGIGESFAVFVFAVATAHFLEKLNDRM